MSRHYHIKLQERERERERERDRQTERERERINSTADRVASCPNLLWSHRWKLNLGEINISRFSSKVAAHIQTSRSIICRNISREILPRYKEIATVHGETVGTHVNHVFVA